MFARPSRQTSCRVWGKLDKVVFCNHKVVMSFHLASVKLCETGLVSEGVCVRHRRGRKVAVVLGEAGKSRFFKVSSSVAMSFPVAGLALWDIGRVLVSAGVCVCVHNCRGRKAAASLIFGGSQTLHCTLHT